MTASRQAPASNDLADRSLPTSGEDDVTTRGFLERLWYLLLGVLIVLIIDAVRSGHVLL
jgi:hypothetical protein